MEGATPQEKVACTREYLTRIEVMIKGFCLRGETAAAIEATAALTASAVEMCELARTIEGNRKHELLERKFN